MHTPSVSVILPVYNESDTIRSVIGSLLGQDYSGDVEIIVADGGSTDGTREILQELAEAASQINIIENPARRQSAGLNAAARVAGGGLLVRADGHTTYAPDYIRRCVEALAFGADATGGTINPVGVDGFGGAVAAAMRSPLAIGTARFHHATTRQEADTVYLGAFPAAKFAAIGGFRAFPSGAAEDADFYYRWRRAGMTVLVDPTIVSSYRPRDTAGSLWRQYFRYGQGKAELLWANGQFPSWRPLAPLILALGLVATTGFAILSGNFWPLAILASVWVGVLLVAAFTVDGSSPRVPLAAGIMHLAYGAGLMWGLLRGPGPVRRFLAR